MDTPTQRISLESIQRQLPSGVREAPLDDRIRYFRRKKGQFRLLFWLGIGMAIFIAVLTAVTFVLPDIDAMENLVLAVIIVAAFLGSSWGNRKMEQRYAAFADRMEEERGKE